ncbi:gliolectin [Drosophila sechellia]|uniref:GM23688 n=1 Tax=Drosophila sechellia TaxID=7238 RepID=B4HM52_DROSE|nr:gliolectin [Drosophila sechellia]EDW43100.1 GM23688 [Drosophila sechellia]
MLCPPMALGPLLAAPVPRPPPSASEKKRICRNLFNNAPGDSNIDQLLAQEQHKQRLYVKERYRFDIQLESNRDADANTDEDADTDAHHQDLRGMRYRTTRTIPSTDADECNPKAVSKAPRGMALTPAQISASAQLILQKCPESDRNKSNGSADLANSTRHGQKPYARQPQGLKGMYNVRKAVNGISKANVKNGYNNTNNNNSSSNNNSSVNNNNTSELADQKQ